MDEQAYQCHVGGRVDRWSRILLDKMAEIAALSRNNKNLVLYVCSCRQNVSLDELFFCRHCKVPRCNDCVSTVLEGSTCAHCFENVAQADAKSKKNCCNHCFRCPQCASSLTTRSIIVPTEPLTPPKVPEPAAEQSGKSTADASSSPKTPKSVRSLRGGHSGGSLRSSPGGTKYYYLSCTHCRWSTRDVAIKDKRSPLDFKDRVPPHQERVSQLLSNYKDLELREKAEKERSKKIQTRKSRPYSSLLDPTKIRSQIGLSAGFDNKETAKTTEIASQAKDPIPPPEDLYSTPLVLEEVTRLEQRYLDPAQHPGTLHELWPRPLQLYGKKLHRCKGCDHILLKADLNLASIRFKIQQMALHCFPRVRLLNWPILKLGEPSEVLLSFTNPLNYPITLSFKQCQKDIVAYLKQKFSPCMVPEGRYTLSGNDDVSDVLSEDGENTLEEDPKYVHTRQLGKVILRFTVELSTLDIDTIIVFAVQFTHKPILTAGDSDSDMIQIEVPVVVNCGHTSA